MEGCVCVGGRGRGVVQEADMVQASKRKEDVHICPDAYETGKSHLFQHWDLPGV